MFQLTKPATNNFFRFTKAKMGHKSFFVFLVLVITACSSRHNSYYDLEKADEYSRQKRYDEAIVQYQKHIAARLADKNRPAWENPWFYLLIIGDIQLGQNKVAEAISSFEQAEKEGIDKPLVADRFRMVARNYENQGNLEAAFQTLQKYRDRDPLLFDLMLDRLARTIVSQENQNVKPKTIPSSK